MKAAVAVQAKPGQAFAGQLAAIAPEVDERNRHFKIDVRVPNDGRTLLSGMYATARIAEAAATDVDPRFPKDAVDHARRQADRPEGPGRSVSIVEVVEGLADGTRVQIVKGLAAGDTVLADARRQLATGRRSVASRPVVRLSWSDCRRLYARN